MRAGWHRRCLFGRHGGWVVRVGCGYELAALLPGSRLPPLTHLGRRWPAFAWALWLALGHHLLLEAVDELTDN